MCSVSRVRAGFRAGLLLAGTLYDPTGQPEPEHGATRPEPKKLPPRKQEIPKRTGVKLKVGDFFYSRTLMNKSVCSKATLLNPLRVGLPFVRGCMGP